MAAVSRNWQLPAELIAISVDKRWPEVLQEWSLDHVEFLEPEEDAKTCLCHHFPIREICYIVNSRNGHTSIVGNCCVTRFGEDEPVFAGTHKIFDAFKRIKRDIDASANKELIDYAFSKGIINAKDHQFYSDIWRKRGLSDLQLGWKRSLNQRIITQLSVSRRPVAEAPASPLDEAPAAPLDEAVEPPAAAAVFPHAAVVVRAQDVANGALRQAVDYLRVHPTALANRSLVAYAYDRGVIKEKDFGFYNSLFQRHVMHPSVSQQRWINDINSRILQSHI